jgi:hypothetical protein
VGETPLPGPGPVSVAAVTGKVPPAVIGGDKKAKGSLVVTVRNDSGADFNDQVNVAILASSDAVADVADAALISSPKTMRLKAGQSKAVKLSVSLMNLPEGTFTLLGAATANGLTSSAAGPVLSVAAPFVRLTAGTAAPGKPIALGKRASLAVPLRNDGNVPTTKTPVTYQIIVSNNGIEAGAVFQTTATGRVAIKPAAAKPQKLAITFPAGAFDAGSYTILVKLTAELNDTNGQTLAAIPVTFV